ncbi:MAG: DUF262 domain-containing protein [Eggerthellaceae bacterium]|nr:DUF262 domain-containing protein [Eggerthellaceae bacterium]
MFTKQESLLDILGMRNAQLVIPVYQRVYAWSERQCTTLWNDVMRAGQTSSTHFMGTVLYVEEACEDDVRRIDVIDGQQRLATLTLLIAALRDHLQETGFSLDGIDAAELDRRYLRLNDAPAKESAEHDGAQAGEHDAPCKLLLSRADRATYAAIVSKSPLPEEEDELSQNVVANYRMFREFLAQADTRNAAQDLWKGLTLLVVISATLTEGDRPQLVFESLNSKGMPLATSDLIRNLLLIGIGLDEQERLYGQYWAPIEAVFADDLDSSQFTAALRGWLAIKAPELCKRNTDDIYATFKAYLESEHAGSLEELLFGLKGFCETFVTRSQSSGARMADAHNSYGVARVEGIISEKKLFGD